MVRKSAVLEEGPLSENVIPKLKEGSKEEVISDLRALAVANPERAISRNWYRVHGKYAESAWSKFFGVFFEFKRQAGIVLTRQQHALERQIAKHASTDHYRKAGAERAEWGDTYVRKDKKRWQLGVFCSDLHDVEIDPFYLRVLIDTVRRAQPDVLSIVGDGMDLPEFGKYGVDPREWAPMKRINFARDKIARPLRAACSTMQFDWIEGNHEFRLLRHMADETPALKVVLAELHGFDVRKLFKLDEFEINWVGKADLSAWTERDVMNELRNNYRIYWEAFLAYHYPDGRNWGMPGCNGHHHKEQVWPYFSPVYGAYVWRQMGAGHRRNASYTEGEKWHLGFNLVHIDTHTRSLVQEYVTIADHAVVGGKLYVREPGEFVNRPLITPESLLAA